MEIWDTAIKFSFLTVQVELKNAQACQVTVKAEDQGFAYWAILTHIIPFFTNSQRINSVLSDTIYVFFLLLLL